LLFILQVIDDPVLRAGHREADGSDRACAPLHAALSVGNPLEFLQPAGQEAALLITPEKSC